MARGPIVAIDGPAGSGKSTTARLVAEGLGFTYLDTGALYRAVTLHALNLGVDPEDEEGLGRVLREIELHFEPTGAGEGPRLIMNGRDVSEEIRSMRVAASVSAVARSAVVRGSLVDLQREIGRAGGFVVEGRDIGTVVFPDAEIKVFLVADVEQRAERRLGDLRRAGDTEISLEQVRKNLLDRDAIDSGRAIAPLRKAADAVELDTSRLTIAEQVDKVVCFCTSLPTSTPDRSAGSPGEAAPKSRS
ncbi:MAG: hypothetical protein CME06_10465 [Gemmatimonadetes bacterium]|nr:hypothetical protein [Gemmatimonadota bacterium]